MKHTCHHPKCDTAVPPKMFACKPHWFSLPDGLRAQIWAEYEPGQEIRKDPTGEYLDAAFEAIEWWEAHP